MEKFNTDLTQVIKWLQNKAPSIQSIINSKSEWYERYNTVFWEQWEKDVFNLDTANEFGIYVWCEILGVPKDNFVFDPMDNAWAFGKERKNFVYSGMNTTIPAANRELVGGNFFGAGNQVVRSLEEARIILKLRYVTLISDGKIASINQAIQFAINKGQPWDFQNLKFLYAVDSASTPLNNTGFKFPDIYVQDVLGVDKLELGTRRNWIGYSSDLRMIQELAGARWNSSLPYKTSQSIESPHIKVIQNYSAIKITALDFDNTGFDFGPRVSTDVQTSYLGSSPSDVIILSTYVKLNGSGDMDMVTLSGMDYKAPNMNDDTVRNWFVNQTATFDFSSRGNPKITVSGVTLADGRCPSDIKCAGFQMLSNGWCRIWNTCIRSSAAQVVGTVPRVGKARFTFYSKNGDNKGKTVSIFGPMAEKLTYSATVRKYPGRVIYGNNNFSSSSSTSFGDYAQFYNADSTVRVTFGNYVFSVNGTTYNVSSLVNNAKAFYGGEWNNYALTGLTQFATGDGYANVFNITQPPGYPGPYGAYQSMGMAYRLGSGLGFSQQMINILSNRELGILPANAGVPYTLIVM